MTPLTARQRSLLGAGGRNRITARQRLILETIAASISENGTGLSVRELGDRVGLSSSSSVSHQLHVLEKNRLLMRRERSWATANLTDTAVNLLRSPR